MSTISQIEYKGHPVLRISNPVDHYPFTFGLRKASMIVEHFEAIREFTKKHQIEVPAAPTAECLSNE